MTRKRRKLLEELGFIHLTDSFWHRYGVPEYAGKFQWMFPIPNDNNRISTWSEDMLDENSDEELKEIAFILRQRGHICSYKKGAGGEKNAVRRENP